MAPCRLRIVVFPETHRTWIARGLEHDLTAEGRTAESAIDTLVKLVLAHIAYDRRHGHEPLAAFAVAPQLYWTAFKAGTPLPISMEVEWSRHGEPAQIVASRISQHPGMRHLQPIGRTA